MLIPLSFDRVFVIIFIPVNLAVTIDRRTCYPRPSIWQSETEWSRLNDPRPNDPATQVNIWESVYIKLNMQKILLSNVQVNI